MTGFFATTGASVAVGFRDLGAFLVLGHRNKGQNDRRIVNTYSGGGSYNSVCCGNLFRRSSIIFFLLLAVHNLQFFGQLFIVLYIRNVISNASDDKEHTRRHERFSDPREEYSIVQT